MQELLEKYEQLMEKYVKLKNDYNILLNNSKKNIYQNDNKNNNINNNFSNQINETQSYFDRCNGKSCLFFCCFGENTDIKVLENNKEVSKPISEIKLNDLVLTYENGNKKYTKVNFFKKYEDDFCYDKNMSEARYLTAEKVTKDDYFYTVDGLYQIYEINVKTKRNKYSLGVEEGAIIASDILVTCFNYNDVNKSTSIEELLSSYKLKNFIN